jgi:proton-translocating NADH-quinone oxidoreductase chain N
MFQIGVYLFGFIISCIAGLIATGIYSYFFKAKRNGFILSAALLILIAIASSYLLVINYSMVELGIIRIYPFSLLFVALFAIAMLLVNMLSYSNAKDYPDLPLLFGFSFIGAFAVATAVSILAVFVGLELLTITTSFMILLEGKHRIKAAVKFFLLGSISIAIFAFALSMLLPYDGQLALAAATINPNITGILLLLISMGLFIAAFGFDTALFPFNLWVPDVYEGAPTNITAMLAGFNKKVAFVAMIEVFFLVFFAYRSSFSEVFAVLAVLTMFFGNLVALAQKNVKRMFAYSSIAQAGYILVGIATASQLGLEASIFYIIAHSFMIIGAFAIVLWLESKNIKSIDDYTALGSRNRFAAIALTIFMLSMAGIPPLIGFAGKFLLFSSAISSGMVLLAIIGIINSFISIYYYAKVMNSMYTMKDEKKIKMDHYVMVVVIIVVAVVILFGIYPQPMISIAATASKAILGVS